MAPTAGIASAVITPPTGTAMEGYSAREGVSQGVHDHLHARALVIDDGDGAVALVGCDLLGVDRRVVALARERASAATGIAPERILVAATHTHAGPVGLRRDVDDTLIGVTAGHIAGAIAAAHRNRRPAVLKVGRATVDSVAQNRRHPDWPVDASLFVLLLDDPDPLRPPIAAAINFACHATVLYHTNLLKSFQSQEEYEACLAELEARVESARDDVEERRRLMAQVTRFRTERTIAAAMAGRTEPLRPEFMAVGFGEGLALLGLPGEFFVETVDEIRQQAGARDLPVACYANHYIGYVVPPSAFEEGGYEPGVTLLAPEAEVAAKREAVSLVRELREG